MPAGRGLIQDIISAASPGPAGSDAYRLSPDAVLLLLQDGTGRLLHFDGKFYALSETAASMLAEVLNHGPAAAVARITAAFAVASDVARHDLNCLLTRLAAQGVVHHGPSGGTALRRIAVRRWGARLLAATAVRFLSLLHSRPGVAALILLALAHGSLRLFGWARTLSAWRSAFADLAIPAAGADPMGAVDAAVRRAGSQHWLDISCKERSLACWAMLRAIGQPVELVVGVDLLPLASHAWCESNGRTLTDYEDRCRRFTPVLRHA